MNGAKLPERIGKYRIIGVVGSGTQGVVLRGLDPHLQRSVAVKVLRSDPSPVEIQRLVSEARNVSRLRHPNVVTLLDFGLVGKKPYLVFELLEGISLRDELRSGRMDLARAVILMSQLLGGVAAAHEQGIVHCDLSPNNIFITDGDFPKVMDFGLSTMVRGEEGEPGAVNGTPRYLYPKPFKGVALGEMDPISWTGIHFC